MYVGKTVPNVPIYQKTIPPGIRVIRRQEKPHGKWATMQVSVVFLFFSLQK
jgi:hypothetical protein